MKKFMLTAIAALFALTAGAEVRANYEVVPLPQDIAPKAGAPFTLTPKTTITFPKGNAALESDATFLAGYIERITGFRPEVQGGKPEARAINLIETVLFTNPEAYELSVTTDSINVKGSPRGIFYGIQTLRKAIPADAGGRNIEFPAATVTDGPRFAYRGAHLDVARHFYTVDEVKSFIDMLVLHNINTFHWHLTDDQGWRLEIKRFPELTKIGSVRAQTVIGDNTGEYDGTPHSGFYTQDEARGIVEYARLRHINVVPEIDMPGHMQAALASYPELGCTGGPYKVWERWGVSDDVLCAGNPKVYEFIDGVLEEVLDIFPSEYIHVGGDECPKGRWEKCPKCQAKIKELGLVSDGHSTAEQKLQSHLIHHAMEFLGTHGRNTIGWEEIIEGGLTPGVVLHSWTSPAAGIKAAKMGHDVIMSPYTPLYFNCCQAIDPGKEPPCAGGYIPLELVYAYEPVPAELTPEEARHILGPQGNLWTERIATLPHAQYMELPRMAALSEIQWSSAPKDYNGFVHRLPRLIAHYDLEGYNYAGHIFNVTGSLTPDYDTHTVNLELSTCDDAPIRYTLDGTEPDESAPLYSGPVKLGRSVKIKALAIRPQGKSEVFTDSVVFSKATARPTLLQHKPHRNFTAKGAVTLTDGRHGAPNYRNGDWVGFYGDSLSAVIDLGRPERISEAAIRCAVCTGDWITDAASFAVAVSDNGTDWREVARAVYPEMTGHAEKIIPHSISFPAVTARYVRISANAPAALPAWHSGAGHLPFIFVDELTIN